MKAIVYHNTHTKIPGWVDTIHVTEPLGYAYEEAGYKVHIYGKDKGLLTLSVGLTASDTETGLLNDWSEKFFGAQNIRVSQKKVGHVTSGVWRPGLYFDTERISALSIVEHEQRSDEQSLRLLFEKLDNIFQYIEPTTSSLSTFSHKTRELLILTCTEIENYWQKYMILAKVNVPSRGFSTKDYVRLLPKLYLTDFKFSLRHSPLLQNIYPFNGWSTTSPTQSLPWYLAYNKTKHDRSLAFSEAKLQNCIEALMALTVMFSVRYSPFPLLNNSTPLSSLFNSIFSISMESSDPCTFYIPKINFEAKKRRTELVCGDARDSVLPWTIDELIV